MISAKRVIAGTNPFMRFQRDTTITVPIFIVSIVALCIVILLHITTSTYSASLTRMSSQTDGIIGTGVVQQGIQENQPIPTSAKRPSVVGNAGNVAKTTSIARIYQLDPSQYNSEQDYSTWAYSACSTAAMTFVMNSYGHTYRIADVLKVESSLHEITPDLGLLEPVGMDHTVAKFGFQTSWLHNPTLGSLLQAADSGTPVIVGFPPDTWAGGHLLVVRGSYTNNKGVHYVHLADSSKLNMEYMLTDTFLKYWRGFAVIAYPEGKTLPSAVTQPGAPVTTASTPYSVLGKPTLTASFINTVLSTYHSPAAGKGQALYAMGVQYHIDPAFALAFFMHESSFGTQGEAMTTMSLGNLRCYNGATCVDQDRGGYAAYSSWEEGFQAWYELIHNVYIGQWGLTTVDTIIPTYAPTADHNDEAAYIASLKHALDTWRAGTVTVN